MGHVKTAPVRNHISGRDALPQSCVVCSTPCCTRFATTTGRRCSSASRRRLSIRAVRDIGSARTSQHSASSTGGAIPYEIVHGGHRAPAISCRCPAGILTLDVSTRRVAAPPREHVVPLNLGDNVEEKLGRSLRTFSTSSRGASARSPQCYVLAESLTPIGLGAAAILGGYVMLFPRANVTHSLDPLLGAGDHLPAYRRRPVSARSIRASGLGWPTWAAS